MAAEFIHHSCHQLHDHSCCEEVYACRPWLFHALFYVSLTRKVGWNSRSNHFLASALVPPCSLKRYPKRNWRIYEEQNDPLGILASAGLNCWILMTTSSPKSLKHLKTIAVIAPSTRPSDPRQTLLPVRWIVKASQVGFQLARQHLGPNESSDGLMNGHEMS